MKSLKERQAERAERNRISDELNSPDASPEVIEAAAKKAADAAAKAALEKDATKTGWNK